MAGSGDKIKDSVSIEMYTPNPVEQKEPKTIGCICDLCCEICEIWGLSVKILVKCFDFNN